MISLGTSLLAPAALWCAAGGCALVALAWAVRMWHRTSGRSTNRVDAARREFRRRREVLELQFLTAAARSGMPRDLEWHDCRFEDEVLLAADPDDGQLRAFVGVTVCFRPVEESGLEDDPAVVHRHAATALFVFDQGRWTTHGRAIFNLAPSEAIDRLGLVPLSQRGSRAAGG